MMANLSRRERTIIAAGLAVGVVIGGWSFVVEPILETTRRAGDLVPAREEVLQKKRDLIARKGVIEAELRSTTERLNALSARFLTSATPAVAASELQKIVKDMAAQANTEVRSERILPPAERGELLEIPVEIAVSGEVRQLVDLLARLDSAPKLLTIQDVRVRVVNVSQPKDLLTTLTLSGYILPGDAASTKSKTKI
jgi:Tfp pilus assembly protein PilO